MYQKKIIIAIIIIAIIALLLFVYENKSTTACETKDLSDKDVRDAVTRATMELVTDLPPLSFDESGGIVDPLQNKNLEVNKKFKARLEEILGCTMSNDYLREKGLIK